MKRGSPDLAILERVTKAIVKHPKDVKVERTVNERGVLLTLHVHPSDLRLVIGRSGRTASSLRVILKAIGAQSETPVNLMVYEAQEAYEAHAQRQPSESKAAETRAIERRSVARLPKGRPRKRPESKPIKRTTEERLAAIETKLDVTFTNKNLLIEALTHRSFLNECEDHPVGHNERLEFLGDAVLEIVVTEYLYRRFPETEEGVLTLYRSALVNARTLSEIAESFGAFDMMFMSKGERHAGSPGNKARVFICANAFEAILGALYLDKGMGECRMFVDSFLLVKLSEIIQEKAVDPKSAFQEDAQERFGITPHYRVLKETGPDHDRRFLVGIYLGELLVAKGEGTSKQEAQTAAAKQGRETTTQWEGRVAEVLKKGSAMRRSTSNGGNE